MAEAKDKDKAARPPKDGAPKGGGKPEPKSKGRPTQSEVAAAGKVKAAPKDYVARLKAQYEREIIPKLVEEFGYKNKLEVPKIEKIVINMGVGEAVQDSKKIEAALRELTAIADPKDGKPTRVGFKVLDDGRKVRFAKRSGDLIDG